MNREYTSWLMNFMENSEQSLIRSEDYWHTRHYLFKSTGADQNFIDNNRSQWKKWKEKKRNETCDIKAFSFFCPSIQDTGLPDGSWFLTFSFRFLTPYLSRDDRELCIVDHPIKKEWVFRVPFIAPSQWKGMLRSVLVNQLATNKTLSPEDFARQRLQLTLLFGDENGELEGDNKGIAKFLDQAGAIGASDYYRQGVQQLFGTSLKQAVPNHSGNLYFYPTFFEKTSLEVINPHSRSTGAGSNPIFMESVSEGQIGRFLLLYVPLYGYEYQNGDELLQQSIQNLSLIIRGLLSLFTEYGMGAKTSSGFGTAEFVNEESGQLWLTVSDAGLRASLLQSSKPGKKTDQIQKVSNAETDSGRVKAVKAGELRKKRKEPMKGLESLSGLKDLFLSQDKDNASFDSTTREEGDYSDRIIHPFKSWEELEEKLASFNQCLQAYQDRKNVSVRREGVK